MDTFVQAPTTHNDNRDDSNFLSLGNFFSLLFPKDLRKGIVKSTNICGSKKMSASDVRLLVYL